MSSVEGADPMAEEAVEVPTDHRTPDEVGSSSTASKPKPLSQQKRENLVKQVEYYFSNENLPTDGFLLKTLGKSKDGWVPLSIICTFNKVKKVTKDISQLAEALRDSQQLELSVDGLKVRRTVPLTDADILASQQRIVLVDNIPADKPEEKLKQQLSQYGPLVRVQLKRAEPAHAVKSPFESSAREHALVEFETSEAAFLAVARMGSGDNWRTALRVKHLLKPGVRGATPTKAAQQQPHKTPQEHPHKAPQDQHKQEHKQAHKQDKGGTSDKGQKGNKGRAAGATESGSRGREATTAGNRASSRAASEPGDDVARADSPDSLPPQAVEELSQRLGRARLVDSCEEEEGAGVGTKDDAEGEAHKKRRRRRHHKGRVHHSDSELEEKGASRAFPPLPRGPHAAATLALAHEGGKDAPSGPAAAVRRGRQSLDETRTPRTQG